MDRIDFHILMEGAERGMTLHEVDFTKVKDYLKNLGPTEQDRINRAVSKMIANSFDPPFGKFLEKTFRRDYSAKIDFVDLVNRVMKGDKAALDTMFDKIGIPLLDFYEKRISSSIFKTTLSGDRKLDRIYARFIQGIFDDPGFIKAYKKRVLAQIKGRVKDVGGSTEFKDLTESVLTEGIFDIKQFRGREARAKYEILDKLLAYIPNVNSELKKGIKRGIFNTSYRELSKLQGKMSVNKAANTLGEVILTYMKIQSIKPFKEVTDPFVKEFLLMLEQLVNNQSVQKKFERDLAEYFAQIQFMQKAK